MLSQKKVSEKSEKSSRFLRLLISGLSVVVLAGIGLLGTATQLQWHLPSLDSIEPQEKIAALRTPKPRTTQVHETFNSLTTTETIVASKIVQKVSTIPRPAAAPASPPPAKSELSPAQYVARYVEAATSWVSPPVQSSPALVIKQPGDDITIKQLGENHKIPLSGDGMPEFYQVVLEPDGRKTKYGLIQRKVRKNFGYDQQDIFTGQVPDGAYVLHCQQPDATKSKLRAMCWRELQISDDQWVQYRFPRTQLKNWWKIEQKVLANIG